MSDSSEDTGGSRFRLVLILSLAVVALASAIIGWELRGVFPVSTSKESLPVLAQAPTYQGLTDQTGATVDSADFRGKVQVVTFLFPYCTTYCPLIAAHLSGFERLLSRAGLADQVRLVAFDVDPANTGRPQMRAFLKEYGWNPDNRHWEFLTGKPKTIRQVVTGGFHVAYRRVQEKDESNQGEPSLNPQPEVVNKLARDAKVDYDISHNDGLVLVDPQGRIRAVHDQADMVSNRELLTEVRLLLAGH